MGVKRSAPVVPDGFRRLLSPEELAGWLNFKTVKPIYRLVYTNAIPYLKPGRKLRFDPAAIERWMSEQGNDKLTGAVNR